MCWWTSPCRPTLKILAIQESIDPCVTEAFETRSRNLSDVCEPNRSGPPEELLLEDCWSLIDGGVSQILVTLAIKKMCHSLFNGDESRNRARALL
jgi:hypothetical protein